MIRQFTAKGWGQAKTSSAKKGNLAIGIALGSVYQAYFASLPSSQQQTTISQMKAAGVSWIRMDAEWWTVQPTQNGGFDWSVPDATADVMLAAGMNLVILLNESPTWARRSANTAPLYSPWQTPDPTLYATYCAAAATYYAAKGVHTFELWNEPNLDTGATTAAGWGYLSPHGYAELAVAAYPAIKAADPKAFVLSGSLATQSEFGTAGTAVPGASWPTIAAGATSASISCVNATATDAYGILSDAIDGWPAGTVITSASAGVGWTVRPPAWASSFPAISSASGRTVQVSGVQYPPDVFLTQAYSYANGQTMFDALAIHPYTQPVLPVAQLAIYGGWATVPTLRSLMIANGDGAKPMWITEVGAPTGGTTASWPGAASSATSLTVSASAASTNDVGYQVVASGLPVGAYASAASNGVSWTVRPPTGMTLITALTSGVTATSITIGPTASVLSIPSGTALTVVVPLASTASTLTFAVTTSSTATTSTSGNTTVSINSATPGFSYPVGSIVRGLVGQTWGATISAGSAVTTKVLAPGVASVFGMVDEATQAAIITQVFKSVVSGVAAGSGLVGSQPWPYVGPIFIYSWGDNGGAAGPFGLVRTNGVAKAAVAALTTVSITGGV